MKYFVDESGEVCDTSMLLFGKEFLYDALTNTVWIVLLSENDEVEESEIVAEYQAWDTLKQLDDAGVYTTSYRMKKFLKDLTHLNETSGTIGAGRLAQIKSEAEFLLDRLNKE